MFLPAGHFTQVVWKDSTQLGVGLATDGRTVFVVGQYRPAGNMNMAGYFEKNVLPLGNYITNILLIIGLSALAFKAAEVNFASLHLQREI